MDYFSQADNPRKAVIAVISLLGAALECYPPEHLQAKPILHALDALSLSDALVSLPQRPFPDDLRGFPDPIAMASRAWSACQSALIHASKGDEIAAWRAVASAALSAGLSLSMANEDFYRREAQRKGGRARTPPKWHTDAPADAKSLIDAGKRARDVAGILAKRYSVTPAQVRRVLKAK
jgi:hypothetical protein